jgi:RNAse (barnase) inhibitor barstar
VKQDVADARALYRLIEDESQHQLLTALDLDGFFVDANASAQPPPRVRMVGTSLPLEPPSTGFHDVELQVLDHHGEVIGAYYIGEARVVHIHPSRPSDRTDLEISFLGYSCPFPYAGQIWRRWASGSPTEPGEWKALPPDWHPSWLHVVQTAWFQAGRTATRYEPKHSYVIDGGDTGSTASFYCALGEAVNGPGGSFGSGLSALADCLMHATADGQPFRIVWRHFDLSEKSLDNAEAAAIVDVFRRFGVEYSLASG